MESPLYKEEVGAILQALKAAVSQKISAAVYVLERTKNECYNTSLFHHVCQVFTPGKGFFCIRGSFMNRDCIFVSVFIDVEDEYCKWE